MYQRLSALYPGVVALSTRDAARVLNRRPQTLRRWACMQSHVIQPVRVGGRLLWRIEDLERVLGICQPAPQRRQAKAPPMADIALSSSP